MNDARSPGQWLCEKVLGAGRWPTHPEAREQWEETARETWRRVETLSVRECGVGGCKVLIDDHTVCGIHGDPPTSPRSVPQTPPDAPRGFRRARSREPGPSR